MDIIELINILENDVMIIIDLNIIVFINILLINDVIENIVEKFIVVDYKIFFEFMDVMVVEVLNYEEKLNEFKEFVKKNFNIMFFVLFMLFLRNFLVF